MVEKKLGSLSYPKANILYIDNRDSIQSMRIEGQQIYAKALPLFGHSIYYLLEGNKESVESELVYRYKQSIFFKLIFNMPILFKLSKIHKEHQLDVIIVRNLPSLAFFPLIFAKSKRIIFVYLKPFPVTETMWHYSTIESSLAKRVKYKVLYLLFKKVESYTFRRADIVVPISDSYCQYLRSTFNIAKDSLIPCPMGFDADALHELDYRKITAIRKQVCPNGEKLLIYFGSTSAMRQIGFILKTLSLVIRVNNQVKMLIIGTKSSDHSLACMISQYGVEDYVITMQQMPRDHLYSYIVAADIALSPIPPLFIYQISSPTKVVESLGLGTPVIANEEIHDQSQLIQDSGGGVVVPYQEAAFAKSIIKLLGDPIDVRTMGDSGQRYVLRNRTYNSLAKQLEGRVIKHLKKIRAIYADQ